MLSVKRCVSESYSHCWKGFKYAEDAVKLKNLQNMEDFSEEQLSLTVQNKQGTHEQPSKNICGSSGNHTVLTTKGSQTFERGYFNNFSYFFGLVDYM